MDTKDLLSILPVKKIEGALPLMITDLAVNSRAINAGGMFVCIIGFTVDGHNFVQQAIDNGARVIVSSKPVDVDLENVSVVKVEHTSRAIRVLAPLYYQ